MGNKAPTRTQVREMTLQGLTARQIATVLGLSTQAIYLHLAALRKAGELPPKEGAA